MTHETVELIDIDRLAEKVGGRFALTSLVAKRLRAINSGAPVLVEEHEGERLIETVCREIAAGKIWLERSSDSEEVVVTADDDIDDLLDMD